MSKVIFNDIATSLQEAVEMTRTEEAIAMTEGLQTAVKPAKRTRLSRDQRLVMRTMDRYHNWYDALLTASDISRICGKRFSDWAGPKLKRLEEIGFVERAGVSLFNGRTWRLTEAGRKQIEAARQQTLVA